MPGLMPRHAPPRAEIASSDSATRQVDQLTHEALGALDHALVAISINPALGEHMPGSALLQHTDTLETVRVNYLVTMSDIVVIVYIEA